MFLRATYNLTQRQKIYFYFKIIIKQNNYCEFSLKYWINQTLYYFEYVIKVATKPEISARPWQCINEVVHKMYDYLGAVHNCQHLCIRTERTNSQTPSHLPKLVLLNVNYFRECSFSVSKGACHVNIPLSMYIEDHHRSTMSHENGSI